MCAQQEPISSAASPAGCTCEGDGGTQGVLGVLGLPTSHVRNVIMHRDIVPRAFACDYTLVGAAAANSPHACSFAELLVGRGVRGG